MSPLTLPTVLMKTISICDVYTQNNPTVISTATKTSPTVTLTGADLRRAITTIGHQLKAAGVKSGDVVSLSLVNSHEIVVAFLAIQAIGAAANPLNPGYTADEVSFYLDDTKSKHMIVHSGTTESAPVSVAAKRHDAMILPISTSTSSTPLITLTHPSIPSSLLTSALSPLPPIPASSVGLILHTSGTTSRPKAVPLTVANMSASVHNITQTYAFTPADVGFLVMPLFHVHGLMCGLLAPLAVGSTIVIQAPKFSASTFLSLLKQYNVTWFTAVPTMHQIMLARLQAMSKEEREKALAPIGKNLRFIRSCSSALSPATHKQMEEIWRVPVLEAYAMTEAAHQMTSNCLPPRQRKAGTVGVAHGDMVVSVLSDAGEEVKEGVEGEICVKGPNVTPGYLNNPKANAETFIRGYLRTGDRGFKDADGFVIITGRLKEQINRGGEKIMPGEVDAALLSHPAVAEAVAYGAPHALLGQTVHAAVKLKSGIKGDAALVEDIKKHVRTQLSGFKVPEIVHIAEDIPRTATGKIQRRFVAEHFNKLGTAKL